MSRATILFYKGNIVRPIYKKVVAAAGISKSEFTTLLFSRADEICKKQSFDSFSILNREDTITEVKK